MTHETTADRFAALLHDDGQCWETDDGRSFDDLTSEFGATYEAYRSAPDGDESAPIVTYQITKDEATTFDRERYVFPDGSAIVAHGDGWDHEGEEPGTWCG